MFVVNRIFNGMLFELIEKNNFPMSTFSITQQFSRFKMKKISAVLIT